MNPLEDDPDLRNRIVHGVLTLPIYVWSWRWRPKRRFIGPTAQDFRHSLGTGGGGRSIDMRDALGVMTVAIQVAHSRIDQLETEVASIRSEVANDT